MTEVSVKNTDEIETRTHLEMLDEFVEFFAEDVEEASSFYVLDALASAGLMLIADSEDRSVGDEQDSVRPRTEEEQALIAELAEEVESLGVDEDVDVADAIEKSLFLSFTTLARSNNNVASEAFLNEIYDSIKER